ncbi:MAG: von Willebrand factor type A domain-containing protein, partial [Gemmatimonadaceae bacterium]
MIAVLTLAAARATTVEAREAPRSSELSRKQTFITGVVRDSDSRKTLDGAQVLIEGETIGSLTGANGVFLLSAGERTKGTMLTVVVRRIGYTSLRKAVAITADTIHVDFVIKASRAMHNEIVMAATGVAVADKRRVLAGGTAQRQAAIPAPSYASTYAPSLAKSARADYESRNTPRRMGSFDSVAGEHDRGNREQYDRILDNPFLAVSGNPRSTFSVDVDRASYGNVRRFLTQGG